MVSELLPEVKNRKFDRIFICRRCGAKIKADPDKVRAGLVKCKKCGYRSLRPKRSEIVLITSAAKK